jgi:hypothetical protein
VAVTSVFQSPLKTSITGKVTASGDTIADPNFAVVPVSNTKLKTLYSSSSYVSIIHLNIFTISKKK